MLVWLTTHLNIVSNEMHPHITVLGPLMLTLDWFKPSIITNQEHLRNMTKSPRLWHDLHPHHPHSRRWDENLRKTAFVIVVLQILLTTLCMCGYTHLCDRGEKQLNGKFIRSEGPFGIEILILAPVFMALTATFFQTSGAHALGTTVPPR